MSISNRERLQIASQEADQLIDEHLNVSVNEANKELNKFGIKFHQNIGFYFEDLPEESTIVAKPIKTEDLGHKHTPASHGISMGNGNVKVYQLKPSDFKDFQSFLLKVSQLIQERNSNA